MCGLLTEGIINEGDKIKIGPDLNGLYHPGKVESIHRNKQPVRSIKPGEAASLAVSFDEFLNHDIEVRKV